LVGGVGSIDDDWGFRWGFIVPHTQTYGLEEQKGRSFSKGCNVTYEIAVWINGIILRRKEDDSRGFFLNSCDVFKKPAGMRMGCHT
jgi:hypothetical protein